MLPFHPSHEQTLTAIGVHVLHTKQRISELEAVFLDAAQLTDKTLQELTILLGALLPVMEEVNQPLRGEALQRLADLWQLDDGIVEAAVELTRGHKRSLLLHNLRAAQLEFGTTTLQQAWQTLVGFLGLDGDQELLRKYQQYGRLAQGTLAGC